MKRTIQKMAIYCTGILLVLSACQQETTTGENSETSTSFGSNETDYLVTIETRHGTMKAILYDETPQHKANFIKLAKEGYFDGTLFHRVMQNFMIQGGDPTSKGAAPDVPLGNGGPDYLIPAELNPKLYHEKGALAAARRSDAVNPEKQSNGSQFYIVQGRKFSEQEIESLSVNLQLLYSYFGQLMNDAAYLNVRTEYNQLFQSGDSEAVQKLILSYKDDIEKKFNVKVEKVFTEEQIQKYTTTGGYPPLDGDYTVFGKVIEGLEVVDKIAAEATNAQNRPNEDVSMKVTVEKMKKAEIMEKFGYDFSS